MSLNSILLKKFLLSVGAVKRSRSQVIVMRWSTQFHISGC